MSDIKHMSLIIADEKHPKMPERTGMEVVRVSFVKPDLHAPSKVAARLCGGTDTCLALVELNDPKVGERYKLDVVSVKTSHAEDAGLEKVAARLCDGGGTCITLAKLNDPEPR
jgi:hypothetical protein